MVETLTALGGRPLLTWVVVLLAAFFSIDPWRRCASAARALGADAAGARQTTGVVLTLWWLGAVALTLVPSLRDAANVSALFQPILTLGASATLGALVFNSVPLGDLLSFFYWRAMFGATLLAPAPVCTAVARSPCANA